MKHAIIAVALIALLASCQYHVDDPPPPGPVTEKAVIRDVDYIQNKYFYFANPRAFIGPRAENPQIEVFRTVLPQDIIADPSILRIPGWVTPDSIGDGQSIRDLAAVLKASGPTPVDALKQDFQLLTFGDDYDFIIDVRSNRTVGIELFVPIQDTATKTLAVSYINENEQAVGGSYRTMGVSDSDSLLLKMLKAPDPRPTGPFGSTWNLEVRSVYYLGWTDIQPGSLKVVIRDVLSPRDDTSRPEGSSIPYLRIFGLDFAGKNGNGAYDGAIDPWFVDFAKGILWMPSVYGFAPDPDNVSMWTDDEFAFTGSYVGQYNVSKQIYENLLNPTQAEEVHQYDIHVTRTMPAQ